MGFASLGLLLLGGIAATRSCRPPSLQEERERRAEEERESWTRWAQTEEQWRGIEAGEALIIRLVPDLERLAEGVLNLELPDFATRPLFADRVSVRDLAGRSEPAADQDLRQIGLTRLHWPAEPSARREEAGGLALWRPLLTGVEYFDHAHFKVKKGRFTDAARSRFEADVAFRGRARLRSGDVVALQGRQRVTWARAASEEAPALPERRRIPGPPTIREQREDELQIWRIESWHTESMEVQQARSPVFEEVLGRVLDDPEVLTRAREALHEQQVVEHILRPRSFRPKDPFFSIVSIGAHPGVSVVDLDRDGFDDFYVMARLGRNLFFRNRGDGSFEEIAGQIGLDLEDHSTSAIFADFDNDGDADLLLGRMSARSVYLVNEDGRFVDRSAELVEGKLPYFTTSVSAADFNDDGLLDVYLSTYARIPIDREVGKVKLGDPNGVVLHRYLPYADARRLYDLMTADDWHQFVNQAGPPNVLLVNRGDGRFQVDGEIEVLRVFRNTFQSTWSDYDADGDPDLYLANDFGPNNLLRNEGGGRFTDVTAETATADVGFGMGASWGDYDNDGRQDLYVSNMYSTAGNRILRQLTHIDETFLGAARGNTLFRNDRSGFSKVSGLEPPALTVEKAGWSWAGQFADFDNDGFQDILALSGYYSAPRQVAIARDT